MINAFTPETRLPFLSQTGEHALRALLYLGQNTARGAVPATEIAEALGAPPNYLAKTLRALVRRKILRSSRGPGGGFTLARSPDTISTAEILAAVDDVATVATCLLGDRPCDPEHPCAAHQQWTLLRERVLAPLSETSVADLLGT